MSVSILDTFVAVDRSGNHCKLPGFGRRCFIRVESEFMFTAKRGRILANGLPKISKDHNC